MSHVMHIALLKLPLRRVQIFLLHLVFLLLELHVIGRNVVLITMGVVQLPLIILVSHVILYHLRRHVIALFRIMIVAVVLRTLGKLFSARIMGLFILLLARFRTDHLKGLPGWERGWGSAAIGTIPGTFLILRFQQLVPDPDKYRVLIKKDRHSDEMQSSLPSYQRSSLLLCPLLLLVIVPSMGKRGSLNDLELDPVP